ncbi:hypothetical protein M408DRAFT_332959 [Serendipita vermifera MAFF 305830]|uniref:NAD(P)-binding protein n=1 Tax=Serendipita vermifera MAFF 305830 TaxID=933852 RepID=A0A0C3ACD2_SERVB|nr:hypothetical protein M408DRAFT_332959 [Serendipita vermifera MAFF 305830]
MTTITDEELFTNTEGLKGKVVLITGGGKGVGQAVAVAFARYGAKIIIGDLDVPSSKHTMREVLRAGGHIGADALVKECNVTIWDDQVALFAAGYQKFGRIDYVVASAGIGGSPDGSFVVKGGKNAPPAKPSLAVLDVNLTGSIYTARLAQYYLMKDKSSEPKAIIFMGSMAGLNGLPHGEMYSASKHALVGFTRSLRDEMKLWGVRVAVVCPWFIDTSILETPTRVMLAGLPMTPLSRVAGAVVHAATDPDWETSGASYALPDDGSIIRIDRKELAVGIYKILHERLNSVSKIQFNVAYYQGIFGDLFLLVAPYLNVVAFLIPLVAYYYLQKYVFK